MDTIGQAGGPPSERDPQTWAAPALAGGWAPSRSPHPMPSTDQPWGCAEPPGPCARRTVLSQGCRCEPGLAAQLEGGPKPEKAPVLSPPAFSLPVPGSIRCSPDQLEPGGPSWDLFQLPAPPRRPARAGAALGCFLSPLAAADRAPPLAPSTLQDPGCHC